MSMTAVIESIEHEAFKRAINPVNEMTLEEYAKGMASDSRFERGMTMQKAKRQCILKEHRCSCGRLLGRFSGQAEVKCPKCGKMNVIGVGK